MGKIPPMIVWGLGFMVGACLTFSVGFYILMEKDANSAIYNAVYFDEILESAQKQNTTTQTLEYLAAMKNIYCSKFLYISWYVLPLNNQRQTQRDFCTYDCTNSSGTMWNGAKECNETLLDDIEKMKATTITYDKLPEYNLSGSNFTFDICDVYRC